MYKRLEMCAYVAAIEKGLPVVKKTVGIENTPGGFENCAVLTALRQAVGHGGEIGSSIWHTHSWNDDTEMWEIEWPEEKLGL
eukprot:4644117-Ditylum_brightwellii.AAC.1